VDLDPDGVGGQIEGGAQYASGDLEVDVAVRSQEHPEQVPPRDDADQPAVAVDHRQVPARRAGGAAGGRR
jgi:hypothetical protein